MKKIIGLILPLGILACSTEDSSIAVNPSPARETASSPVAEPEILNPAETETQVNAMSFIEVSPEWSRLHSHRLFVPGFNMSPEEMTSAGELALYQANMRVENLAKRSGRGLSYEKSFGELDRIFYELQIVANPLELMEYVSPDAGIRDAAAEQSLKVRNWYVNLNSNRELYLTLKQAAEGFENLSPAQEKFVRESLRSFERSGMALTAEEREKITKLQLDLAKLEQEFSRNINEASGVIQFYENELKGVPQDFLKSRTVDGLVTVNVAVTHEYLTIAENADYEDVRKRAKEVRYSLAKDKNTPILQQMVEHRDQIAAALGYASWADYQTEIRMAKSASAAIDMLEDMVEAFDPKFQAELNEMKALKDRDRSEAPENVISEDFQIWDFRYYQSELKRTRYNVDTSELSNYFEIGRVKDAVFKSFGNLFQLDFVQMDAPYKWVDDLEFYMVFDRRTKAPLGLFYLDMYPRANKYGHFAHFTIMPARRMESGVFNRPVSALVCNFPRATADRPSLLTHDHVETFFHEFGHLIHSMVTQAEISSFSGTSVERDFVEAPSQIFEAWASDYDVLSSFAQHYQDPEKKISRDLLERMKEAKLGTIGFHYRRQLSFGLMDMRFHAATENKDVLEITNSTFEEVFLPAPEDSSFAAFWGHMVGYDAGYYGYAWADVISEDLLSAFRNSPLGLNDMEVGMRLRNEIFAVGGSRDANESIEAFLGRPYTLDSFRESFRLNE